MKGARHVANNLTREEARDRRQLLDVGSYQVELDLTGGGDTFLSTSTVRFQCASTEAASFIELTARAVREIVLNGEPVRLSAFDGNRIALEGLRPANELRVVAECAYSRSGEGLHRFTDPTDGGVYLYSDLETFDAHRIYACFDQPDLKATFEFSVIAPEDWIVLSNMAAGLAAGPRPGGPGAGTSPRRRSCPATSRPSWRARTTRSRASTTASRWASTAAAHWPGTWTPRKSSR